MPGAGDYRSMPADFAENAWLRIKDLEVMYTAGQKTIRRWRDELGGADPRQSLRIPPADFSVRAKKTSKRAMAAHYGVGADRINSWLKSLTDPLKPPSIRVLRPAPEDFAEFAPTVPQTMLIKHYAADYNTVKRWFAETGTEPLPYTPSPPPRRNFVFKGHAQIQRHADLRTITMFDQAADDLRRERFVVFRCDQRGRANPKGDLWRIGNTLLTPDELLQRARKYQKAVA